MPRPTSFTADDPGDLGVVVFDTLVAAITPATLPAAGLLDALGPLDQRVDTPAARAFLGGYVALP
jgi:hypothetical protein